MMDGPPSARSASSLETLKSSVSTVYGAQPPANSTFYHDKAVPVSHHISTIDIDCTGNFAVLAGKKWLKIVELETPEKFHKTLTPPTAASTFPVSCVRWSPHSHRASHIASSSNTTFLLWDVNAPRAVALSTVKAHSRPVRDVAWSVFEPDVLASCSADTNIHLWDVRTPRQCGKLKTFYSYTEGASQVCWNKFNPNQLASTHSGEVRVWDIRRDTSPLTFIMAHNTKINCVDWSPLHEHDLVTCGQDKSVKFWSTMTPRVCNGTLRSPAPVAQAQYLPVGEAIVTMPQRHSNSLSLWLLSDLTKPAHRFTGHADLVTHFTYRVRRLNPSSTLVQLVSWSRDQHIRMWSMSPELLRECRYSQPPECWPVEGSGGGDGTASGRSRPSSPRSGDTASRDTPSSATEAVEWKQVPSNAKPGTKSRSMSDVSLRSGARESPEFNDRPSNIRQEFEVLAKTRFSRIDISELSAARRVCLVQVLDPTSRSTVVLLRVTFPLLYPNNAPPSFHFLPATMLCMDDIIILKRVLSRTAQMSTECNEPCMRSILEGLEQLKLRESSSPSPQPQLSESAQVAEKEDPSLTPLMQLVLAQDRVSKRHNGSESSRPLAVLSEHRRFAADDSPPASQGKGSSSLMPGTQTQGTSGMMSLGMSASSETGMSPTEHSLYPPRMSGACFSPSGFLVVFHNLSNEFTTPLNRGLTGESPETALEELAPLFGSPVPSAFVSRSPHHSPDDDTRRAMNTLGVRGGSGTRSVPGSLSLSGEGQFQYEYDFSRAGFEPDSDLFQYSYFYDEFSGALGEMRAPMGMPQQPSFRGSNLGAMSLPLKGVSVSIMNVSQLTGIDERLAHEYKVTGVSAHEVCCHNARVAARYKRRDHERLWALLSLVTDPVVYCSKTVGHRARGIDDEEVEALGKQWMERQRAKRSCCMKGMLSRDQAANQAWAMHPFGRELVRDLFAHAAKWRDIQALCLMSCILSIPPRSESGEEMWGGSWSMERMWQTQNESPDSLGLLDPARTEQYNTYCVVYAEILCSMGFLLKSTEVMKFVSHSPPAHQGIEFGVYCRNCRQRLTDHFCTACNLFAFSCSICHRAVKGLATSCLACGHGGHVRHLREWFRENELCPWLGCGCRCKQTNPHVLEASIER